MADEACASFLSNSKKIINIFYLNINQSKNMSGEIKSKLIKCITELSEIIEEQNKLIIKQNIEFVNELKQMNGNHINAINNVNKTILEIKSQAKIKTFSEVLKDGQEEPSEKHVKHLVLIRPTDKTKTPEETESVVKDIVKPNKHKIGIKSKKHVSNGGIIIECRSQEECEKISELIEKKTKEIEVKKPAKMKPKLILNNVNTSIDENVLIDKIRENNKEIDDYLSTIDPRDIGNEISVKFKFRKKDPKMDDKYCLEVSSQLRKIIIKTKRIFIDWISCKVEDSLPIVKCFRCQRFGHKSKECRKTTDICGHCGGDHKSKECNLEESQPFCSNCDNHNKNSKSRIKYNTVQIIPHSVIAVRHLLE